MENQIEHGTIELRDCRKCKNRIFDEVWGDLKCGVRQHRIYISTMYPDCEYYQEGEGAISKNTYERELKKADE